MLVLSRKMGESILIGDNIKVTVISQKNRNQVRIGISAPDDIHILRAELEWFPTPSGKDGNKKRE